LGWEELALACFAGEVEDTEGSRAGMGGPFGFEIFLRRSFSSSAWFGLGTAGVAEPAATVI
jgi:hypothetical protein